MKILHVYKDYFPVLGGIENHIKLLAETQVKLGHAVSVLVTSRDRHTHIEQLNGVRVIFAARDFTLSSAPISLAMFDLIRRETPDVAHLHFPYPLGELAQYFFGRARRVVLTYHSDIIRQKYLRVVYRPLMERMLARVDCIMPTSPNYIDSSAILPRYKNKCVPIPLGIDPSPFINADSRLTPHDLRLLFVGKLRYYKGLNYLLEAMPQIPRVRLTVVGTGPMEREWKSLAQQLGIMDRVEFLGEVSDADLPAYFAACDLFVLPSVERSEAFGIVQLEAMASGKPVVCTELGTGTSYVTVNETTGLVVPARDSAALAVAINRLIDDPGLRARMGAAGRARVMQEFTIDKMIERVMKVYES